MTSVVVVDPKPAAASALRDLAGEGLVAGGEDEARRRR